MDTKKLFKHIPWVILGIIGAFCLAVVALRRGEHVSALWIVVASVSVYLVAYRYYSLYIAQKVMKLDPTRATPAVINNDGLNYVPTNRYVLFGHHFAAIAGAGPLVGPVLAAQMGYLLYQGVVDPLGGVKSLWPLFGISNQMLAAVALVLGTVVLIKMKRTQYIWVTVVPAVWLLICTTWALGLKLFSTNPQMEGFFYMASQYKEKIANGTDLTAQQIANMNHIVVNNYTNAGLSILFLIVVYSIIFYGFKTWLAVRNSDKRTDKETPYVPIPEGGVKISSHH